MHEKVLYLHMYYSNCNHLEQGGVKCFAKGHWHMERQGRNQTCDLLIGGQLILQRNKAIGWPRSHLMEEGKAMLHGFQPYRII